MKTPKTIIARHKARQRNNTNMQSPNPIPLPMPMPMPALPRYLNIINIT